MGALPPNPWSFLQAWRCPVIRRFGQHDTFCNSRAKWRGWGAGASWRRKGGQKFRGVVKTGAIGGFRVHRPVIVLIRSECPRSVADDEKNRGCPANFSAFSVVDFGEAGEPVSSSSNPISCFAPYAVRRTSSRKHAGYFPAHPHGVI